MGVRKVKLARGAFISWILEFVIRAKTKKREIWDNQKFITLVLRVQYLKGQQIDDIGSYILSALLIWQCSLAHPSTIPHHVVGITKQRHYKGVIGLCCCYRRIDFERERLQANPKAPPLIAKEIFWHKKKRKNLSIPQSENPSAINLDDAAPKRYAN